MATMIISLPDPMNDWIEARIKQGEFASMSDYVRDLVQRDHEQHSHPDLTLGDLQRIVAEARASGLSNKTVPDILAEAAAKARRVVNE